MKTREEDDLVEVAYTFHEGEWLLSKSLNETYDLLHTFVYVIKYKSRQIGY